MNAPAAALKTKNTQGEKKKLLNPWVQNRVVFCSIWVCEATHREYI